MIRVTVHTDQREEDVTQWVKTVSITRTILEPYESARVDLLVPFGIEVLPSVPETGAVDIDAWVVIYHEEEGDRERAVFLGCLSSITGGYYADSGGELEAGIRARELSLRCDNWLKPVKTGEIYLSGEATALAGHILDIEQFGERFRELGSLPFQTKNVGEALSRFWVELSQYYRLPETLGGQSIAYISGVSYDETTALKHTPSRIEPHRGVLGLALNATSGAVSGGGATAWGIIRSIFGAEPNMLELFASLEPTNDDDGALEKRLGARPVIIYRIKPFVFGEYSQKTSDSALRRIDNTEGASRVATTFSANDVISVDFSISDSDRVNGVYLHTPLTPSRSVELFGLAGEPVFNEDDIDRQGLRMFKGQWPFFPQGKKREENIEGYREEIQELIDLATAITEDDHRFLNGTIQMRGRPSLQAGVWVKLDLSIIGARALVVYVESVTTTVYVREDGIRVGRSSLEFTRGFYND